jgi:hypothetical protein
MKWWTGGTKTSTRRGGEIRNYGQRRTPFSVFTEHGEQAELFSTSQDTATAILKWTIPYEGTKVTDKCFTFLISSEIHWKVFANKLSLPSRTTSAPPLHYV